MENGSIKTQNRVVFTLMLLLLLSIGCALRLPSLFCLIHSHQRLFVDSRGFFLREHHSNGWSEIDSVAHLSPSVCLLGDGHDIRPIRIGEGQEHNHSVHCAIQRGEWGLPICPSLHVLQRTIVFRNTNASDNHCFPFNSRFSKSSNQLFLSCFGSSFSSESYRYCSHHVSGIENHFCS